MFIKHFKYIFSIILIGLGFTVRAQSANAEDSTFIVPRINMDSVNLKHHNDSLQLQLDPADRLSPEKEVFEDEIIYSADSIVGIGTGLFLLYGNAEVSYGADMKLSADFIRLNMDSSLIFAMGGKDSAGADLGLPEFIDAGTSYVSKQMVYNFSTGKGFITDVVTEQGEGYVTSHETKRINDEAFCMRGGKYTTCDNHDHPHFYLSMSKAKVRPGKNIVTGPAHLVIEDVHLPLFIPFGFFPFTESYSSGFVIPEFGEEQNRGFFLSQGGYYFAISDYFDFKGLGSIYTNGSWDMAATSAYKVRYKYSGSFNAQFMTNVTGEKGEDDYAKSKDFRITWSHRQDPKANMYQTFSSSVNFSTSSYDRNNVETYFDPQTRSQNHKQSSITYSRRFADAPFSLSGSALAAQNSKDSTLNLTLPQLNFSMSRITPFKRKVKVGKTLWYEKIGMTYSGVMSNSISGKQDEVFKSNLLKDWKNGIQHSIPFSTSFNVLKSITITPSVSYTEKWYSSHLEKNWNDVDSVLEIDTIYGFNRVYDYQGSLSASTKLYGFYKPWRKLFGDKVEAIRHVMTPSVSMSYRPDFGQDKFGFYDTYQQKFFDEVDSVDVWQDVRYSKYDGYLYGNSPTGKSGMLNMSLGNNVEMKVRSDKDTANQFKKIKLIESLSFSTGYNMSVDSFNWSPISVQGRTTLFKNFSINFGARFDPYVKEVNSKGQVVRVNKTFLKEEGRIGQLTSANASSGYRLDNKLVSEWFSKGGKKGEATKPADDDGQADTGKSKAKDKPAVDEYGYTPFTVPWSLSFSYSYRLNATFNKVTHDYDYDGTSNLSVNGNIELTNKWILSGSSGYDFKINKVMPGSFNLSRDLHCWSMNMSFVPFGQYTTYKFTIKVNSTILQDLKYEQQKSPYD